MAKSRKPSQVLLRNIDTSSIEYGRDLLQVTFTFLRERDQWEG
jgi:hypothetical protein